MTETESKIVTHDVVVPASPDTVQAIVSDLRTWPQYHPSAAHAEILGRDLSGLNVCRRGHALRRRTSLAAASASRAPTTPGATAPTVPCSPSPVMPEGAPSPADLDCFLGGFRRDLADLDLAAYEIYGYESQAWDINWKLVVEGTLEGYHFPFLHTKSAHPLFENTFFFDTFGPHLRSILPKRSINFVTKTERSERRLLSVANVIHTIFPNETVLHQSDHFLWITSHPLGPTRTLVKLRLIVPRGSVANDGAERWEANRELTYQVQYEDLEIYREIQIGVATGANQEHCFGTQEFALQKYNEAIESYLSGAGLTAPNGD